MITPLCHERCPVTFTLTSKLNKLDACDIRKCLTFGAFVMAPNGTGLDMGISMSFHNPAGNPTKTRKGCEGRSACAVAGSITLQIAPASVKRQVIDVFMVFYRFVACKEPRL